MDQCYGVITSDLSDPITTVDALGVYLYYDLQQLMSWVINTFYCNLQKLMDWVFNTF